MNRATLIEGVEQVLHGKERYLRANAVSSDEKQGREGSDHRRTGGAKVGKPVRRTNKSGLPPPQTQEHKC